MLKLASENRGGLKPRGDIITASHFFANFVKFRGSWQLTKTQKQMTWKKNKNSHPRPGGKKKSGCPLLKWSSFSQIQHFCAVQTSLPGFYVLKGLQHFFRHRSSKLGTSQQAVMRCRWDWYLIWLVVLTILKNVWNHQPVLCFFGKERKNISSRVLQHMCFFSIKMWWFGCVFEYVWTNID